ncbi:hypothetical protein HDV02_001365 [Globomyces sp. JEL0801]|nr:hypothetical protein HDV02_001365 [Globomyces sp. JEL0801]
MFYDYNPALDELKYINFLADSFRGVGLPTRFIIDSSRNAIPGIRNKWGSWCNIRGAGIGMRPRANPFPMVDALVWAKPPGESDGASSGNRSDGFCNPNHPEGSDALPNAPIAGEWFHDQFVQLCQNAKL